MAFWRALDGSEIEADEAYEAWAPHVRAVLETVAAHYGAILAPQHVADQVQERAGVQTNLVLHNWLDRLLAGVGDDLDALVVDPKSRCVGPRYAGVPGRWFDTPKDREEAATLARFAAYQRFCPNLPEDAEPGPAPVPTDTAPSRPAPRQPRPGGTSRAPAATRAPRTRAKAPAKPRSQRADPPPRPICPTCFLEMPATGVCASCD